MGLWAWIKTPWKISQDASCLEVKSWHLASWQRSQAKSWKALTPNGAYPARHAHETIWSDVADGFYIFGGSAPSLFRVLAIFNSFYCSAPGAI